MPVYNAADYLEQSIRSILDQTFSNFELIIVNDGSTDSSATIIERMRALDSRIIVIDLQDNKGISAARNAGIAVARGEFIACMDADDISLPDRFRLQYDFLRANSDVVLVGGMARFIDRHGTLSIGSDGTGSRHSTVNLLCFPPKIVTAVHPLIMVRTEALKAIGGYDMNMRVAHDYEMFIRISRLGRIAHIDQSILHYRIHGENISVRKLVDQEEAATAVEVENVNNARAQSGRRRLRLGVDTRQAYVSIRILRREHGLGIHHRPKVYVRIFGKILKGAPKSELFTTGRLVLMLTFHGIKSIKSSRAGLK